jgi:hypothetical protein
MTMRQILGVCLLLVFSGCDKQPPLGLPASYWNMSKPITGYQWYINGEPGNEHGEINKSTKLLLHGSTSNKHDYITWTLQVAPGKDNVIARGRITIDPKNLPKLDWPASGNLTIGDQKCILRIEQHERNGSISNVRELFVYTGSSSNTEQGASSHAASQRP